MSDDQHYRPRSPDLPGIGSHNPPPRLDRLPSYQIEEPSIPQGYSFSPRGSYDASPFFSPSTQQPSTSYFGSRSGSQPNSYHHQSPKQFAPASLPRQQSQPNPALSPVYSQSPQRLNYQPTYSNPGSPYQPSRIPQQAQYLQLNQPFPTPEEMARLRQRKAVNYNENHNGSTQYEEPTSYIQPTPMAQPPLMAQPPFSQPMSQQQVQHPQQHFTQEPTSFTGFPPAPPAVPQTTSFPSVPSNIDVRTKFPVARIKRIMQADEDVGKVAQATPTAVSKALELFMIALVSKGAKEAKSQNSKRVTATHLKTALLNDPQFDFLNDICESVPDEGGKKGRAKSEAKSEHDDIDSDDSGPVKKKRKGKKAKKGGSDADSD